jgi:uncharacterized membrane-anchored protein YhcB (DUF1043 family)
MDDNITTNLQTMALWAAIIIALLSGVGTLITRSLNSRIDDQKEELEKAEHRVHERERLAIDAVKAALDESKEAAKEKRAEDLKRIERLEAIYDAMNQLEPRKRP